MDDLAKQILEALEDYSEEVEEIVEDEIENVANEAVSELKANSPKRKRNGGKYARSWRKTKVKDGYSVHNTKAGLTHLLEKGHAKRNGGRTKAMPHIAPVEQKVIQDLEENIKRRVQK